MTKAKSNSPGVQNKAMYSRASYLYQAAGYLASRAHDAPAGAAPRKTLLNLSRQAVADLRAVSLKVQMRQAAALKRTLCKACDTLQVEGRTCRSVVENASRGARKPWADVLAITCAACGCKKRYPVCAPRQKRKALRPRRDAGEAARQDAREPGAMEARPVVKDTYLGAAAQGEEQAGAGWLSVAPRR